jgi:hypothetical protein
MKILFLFLTQSLRRNNGLGAFRPRCATMTAWLPWQLVDTKAKAALNNQKTCMKKWV